MKLEEYFKKTEIPIAKFCRRIKITPPTLYAAMKGSDIRISVAKKIIKGTNGEVTINDLGSPIDNI